MMSTRTPTPQPSTWTRASPPPSSPTSTRDRLALACVSRVWRKVATSEESWGTCDLVLDGELGKKITDDRFARLLRYCGDGKHLEIRDAPESFEGGWLTFDETYFLVKFASLETLKLINCPGLNDTDILGFLQDIGMPDHPKDKRLRYLRLAGCEIERVELDEFRECLRDDPSENFFKSDRKNQF